MPKVNASDVLRAIERGHTEELASPTAWPDFSQNCRAYTQVNGKARANTLIAQHAGLPLVDGLLVFSDGSTCTPEELIQWGALKGTYDY